jgi:hypothetical protein
MKPKKFNVGDKVKVIGNGQNCSDLSSSICNHVLGAYQFNNFKDMVFTVYDNSHVKYFENMGEVNVYILQHESKLVGAVYEQGLERVDEGIKVTTTIKSKKELIDDLSQMLLNNEDPTKCLEIFITVLKHNRKEQFEKYEDVLVKLIKLF